MLNLEVLLVFVLLSLRSELKVGLLCRARLRADVWFTFLVSGIMQRWTRLPPEDEGKVIEVELALIEGKHITDFDTSPISERWSTDWGRRFNDFVFLSRFFLWFRRLVLLIRSDWVVAWGWLDADNLLDERIRMSSSRCWQYIWWWKWGKWDGWWMEACDMPSCTCASFAPTLAVLWLKRRSTLRLSSLREYFRRSLRAFSILFGIKNWPSFTSLSLKTLRSLMRPPRNRCRGIRWLSKSLLH